MIASYIMPDRAWPLTLPTYAITKATCEQDIAFGGERSQVISA